MHAPSGYMLYFDVIVETGNQWGYVKGKLVRQI